MKDEELVSIVGGGISATLLNSLSRLIDTIVSLGRSVGTSIRMFVTGKRC